MACRSNECRAGWRKRPSMSDVQTAVLRTEAAVVRVLSQKGPSGLSPLPGETHPSAGTWCLHDRDHPRSSQSGRAAAAFAYEPICNTVEATQASVRDGSASLVMSITASATAQSPIASPAVASKMVQHFPSITARPPQPRDRYLERASHVHNCEVYT
jgi:hypothetical protein